MKYFKDINTLDELRKHYKELRKKYHPDNGGNVADMQEINAEYDQLFKVLKERHESKSENTSNNESDHSSNMYNWENDKALREVLEKIIHFNGIEINLVGAWVWLDGNTYPYKEELKNIGFRWSRNRKKWYWNHCRYWIRAYISLFIGNHAAKDNHRGTDSNNDQGSCARGRLNNMLTLKYERKDFFNNHVYTEDTKQSYDKQDLKKALSFLGKTRDASVQFVAYLMI